MKGENVVEYLMTYGWIILIVIIIAAALLSFGVFNPETYKPNEPVLVNNTTENEYITEINQTSFTYTGEELCLQNGNPAIFLFSTSTCPHCNWIGPIFDRVVEDYIEDNKTTAYHLQLDTRIETLSNTSFDGLEMNEEIIDLYAQLNPRGAVPAMLFGCEYFSLGASHERQENGEQITEEEFKVVIEEILEGQ